MKCDMFIISGITELMYRVSLNPEDVTGEVITNVSYINRDDLDKALGIMEQVFFSELAFSPYIKIIHDPPEFPNKICLVTICSLTLDGVLLHAGIPTNPRGGGIVQIKRREPTRFTEFIEYRSTTIDPLEVLMSQPITSVMRMIKTGSGGILASLREAPMIASEDVEEKIELLIDTGFMGVLDVGEPNSDVLGLTVSRDHIGIGIAGGVNPIAALQESSIEVRTQTMSSLMDISEMERI